MKIKCRACKAELIVVAAENSGARLHLDPLPPVYELVETKDQVIARNIKGFVQHQQICPAFRAESKGEEAEDEETASELKLKIGQLYETLNQMHSLIEAAVRCRKDTQIVDPPHNELAIQDILEKANSIIGQARSVLGDTLKSQ